MAKVKVKKDCAFQFAVGNKYWLDKSPIIEDTGLVTFEQARDLWHKYLPDFIRRLEEGQEPEMAIWVDMDSNTDYHTDKFHLDARDNLEVIRGRIFRTIQEEVEQP